MCTALSYFSDRSQTAICQPFGNHWMRPLPDYRGCCWNSLSMTLRYVLSQENSRTFQTALAENLSVKLNHLTTRRCNRRQSCWETCNRKQHPEKIQGQLKYWETSRVVMEYVLKWWPLEKEQVDVFTREYWNFRVEMDLEDAMLLKSDRTVALRSLRAEV